MKYRVELDLTFDSEADAIDFLNSVEVIKGDTYTPTGLEQILCYQKCRYHQCNHEELNPTPCGNYVNVNFGIASQIHGLGIGR